MSMPNQFNHTCSSCSIQYLEDNEVPVVALREGAMVRLEKGAVLLKGTRGAAFAAVAFRRRKFPFEPAWIAELFPHGFLPHPSTSRFSTAGQALEARRIRWR